MIDSIEEQSRSAITGPPHLSGSSVDRIHLNADRQPWFHRIYALTGPHFVLVMILATRLVAGIFGGLTVAYVVHTLGMRGEIRRLFITNSTLTIVVAIVLTTFTAMLQMRTLKRLLLSLHHGSPRTREIEIRGVQEAILFPGRNALIEMVLDPLLTVLPICTMLWFYGVGAAVAIQTCVAGFMGISCCIMSMFLLTDSWLRPVVQDILDRGIKVNFDEFPHFSLQRRMQVVFGTTILVTATMIGGLSYRQIFDIGRRPDNLQALAWNMSQQLLVITVLSLVVGLSYSSAIATSVGGRVAKLVNAMKRVQQGEFSFHIRPSGTDEIDVLTRQFNQMVDELFKKEQQVQELTAGLESTVEQRTKQLQASFNQVKAMQVQMIQTEKMTSLGQLVAGLAHEINNAINAVYNGTPAVIKQLKAIEGLLQGELKTAALEKELLQSIQRIYKLLDVIEEGATRTVRIVNDMKTFSHPNAGKWVELDTNGVLEMCLNLLRLPRPGVILVQKEFGDIPVIRGPFGQIDQVILNILSNAIDAMPRGGQLKVRTRCQKSDIEISIRDSGTGIPSKIRQQIFNPFFTTKPPGKGTGLGLSISYGIVRKLGGSIEIAESNDQGTEFRISIPREISPDQ